MIKLKTRRRPKLAMSCSLGLQLSGKARLITNFGNVAGSVSNFLKVRNLHAPEELTRPPTLISLTKKAANKRWSNENYRTGNPDSQEIPF